jgi:hypothetical protein
MVGELVVDPLGILGDEEVADLRSAALTLELRGQPAGIEGGIDPCHSLARSEAVALRYKYGRSGCHHTRVP